MRESLWIQSDGVLEARLVLHSKPKWCAVCLPLLCNSIMWTKHARALSGVARTISWFKLTWYWPGMTLLAWNAVRSCVVGQADKQGGGRSTKDFQRKQRLHVHARRPWQKVAVDLVKPMPQTTKENRWILLTQVSLLTWHRANLPGTELTCWAKSRPAF